MSDLSSVDSISYAIPTAICVFFTAFMIFSWEHLWPFFRVVLYLGLPLLVYLLTAVVTLLAQYSGCGTVRVGDVFLYSLPSAGLSLVALLLSSFSWLRIPMASVVAPLFTSSPESQNNKTTSCCESSMTLETIELQSPMVKGFAYGFYLFFSTIFGVLVSIGFASLC